MLRPESFEVGGLGIPAAGESEGSFEAAESRAAEGAMSRIGGHRLFESSEGSLPGPSRAPHPALFEGAEFVEERFERVAVITKERSRVRFRKRETAEIQREDVEVLDREREREIVARNFVDAERPGQKRAPEEVARRSRDDARPHLFRKSAAFPLEPHDHHRRFVEPFEIARAEFVRDEGDTSPEGARERARERTPVILTDRKERQPRFESGVVVQVRRAEERNDRMTETKESLGEEGAELTEAGDDERFGGHAAASVAGAGRTRFVPHASRSLSPRK